MWIWSPSELGLNLLDFPKLDCALCISFHTSLNFSGSVVLEKIFQRFSYINTFKMWFSILWYLMILHYDRNFYVNLNFLAYNTSLWRRVFLSFDPTWISSPRSPKQLFFFPSMVYWPCSCGEQIYNVKVYRQTDGGETNRWQIKSDQKRSCTIINFLILHDSNHFLLWISECMSTLELKSTLRYASILI
jgi:hypothetical protein